MRARVSEMEVEIKLLKRHLAGAASPLGAPSTETIRRSPADAYLLSAESYIKKLNQLKARVEGEVTYREYREKVTELTDLFADLEAPTDPAVIAVAADLRRPLDHHKKALEMWENIDVKKHAPETVMQFVEKWFQQRRASLQAAVESTTKLVDRLSQLKSSRNTATQPS